MNQDNFSVRFENRFIMVNYDVIMSGLLTAYEIAVYVTLCAYASNADRSCFPSYSTLARRAGCCRSTAIRAIARLEELGFIEKQNQSSKAGDSTSNLYTIKTAVTVQKEKVSSKPVPSEQSEPVEKSVDNLSATASEAPDSEGVVYDTDYRSVPDTLPPVYDVHHPGVPDTPELYLNNYKDFNNYPHSIYPRVGAQADAEREQLKERIEYDYFEQELPDRLAFVDMLVEVILSLRHEDKPENRRLLAELDSLAVMEFMEDIKGKDLSEVRNTFAWTRTVFMEFLRRRDLLLKDFW